MYSSVYELLKAQAGRAPESVAILAPDQAPLAYSRLQGHVRSVVTQLNELGIGRIQYDEGDLLFLLYHSSSMGATNIPQLQDAEMDQLLETTRSASSLEERQEALDAAQKYAVENALAIPLYAAKSFRATSKRLKNAMFMPGSLRMYLYDAYIET